MLLPIPSLTLLAAVVHPPASAAALELLGGVGLPDPARCALAFGELVVDDVDGHESDGFGDLASGLVVGALVEHQGEGVGLWGGWLGCGMFERTGLLCSPSPIPPPESALSPPPTWPWTRA